MPTASAFALWTLLLASCSPVLGLRDGKPIPTSCDSDDACGPGQVCDHAQCLTRCGNDEHCGVGGQCVFGVCLDAQDVCRTAARRCDGLQPQTCNENHSWVASDAACATGCHNGQCFMPQSCDDGILCGTDTVGSCCEAKPVERGTISLEYQSGGTTGSAMVERSVGPFAMDRFEVTIGRFLAFANTYAVETLPAEGQGAHPRIADSGWSAVWNDDARRLPRSRDALLYGLTSCEQNLDLEPDMPVGCVSWYLAFAFCIWDGGGRLPSEAEWAFAALGGAEQRFYPWSEAGGDQTVSEAHAVYSDAEQRRAGPDRVGSHPLGVGKYGHEDLSGNLQEWVVDSYHRDIGADTCQQSRGADPSAAVECIDLVPSNSRTLKGGSFADDAASMANAIRTGGTPASRELTHGFRCIRQ